MGPLEILWLVVFIFFILISVVRGYERELGVATMIFVALFLITQFGVPYLPIVFGKIAELLGDPPLAERAQQHLLSLIFSGIFLAIILAAYAGDTFSFRGKLTRGPGAFLLDILVGILNGYLVAGTLWYFQDAYAYPAADFGLLILPLTPLAETLANFLPPYVAPPLFWAAMVMLLLIIRIRR